MTSTLIIFSDLDGTLLDHSTYSFEAALPALDLIRQHQIPLILVSSKTREELYQYQRLTGIAPAPFVVENGSAICHAGGFFERNDLTENEPEPRCKILGKTFAEIRSDLLDISKKYRYNIRGFHNASAEEVQQKTGLSKTDAERAMRREFSVPLFFDERAEKILKSEIKNYRLRLLFGGRFMHLLGMTDKGKAVKIILQRYRDIYTGKTVNSIGIGDSLNDEAMLKEVDVPVLVRKKDGSHEPGIKIKGLLKSPGIGPQGWNQSLISLINEGVKNE